MSNIQEPNQGGKKPTPSKPDDERKQTQRQPGQQQDEGDGKDIEKDAPGQRQGQEKKKLGDKQDGGMDAGKLGERPQTEETEMDDSQNDGAKQ